MSDYTAPQSDHGSFWAGFSVGMLAGAVSYFLFATDKGVTVRRELKDEWEAAQKKTADQVGQAAVLSIRSLVKEALDQLATKLEIKQSSTKDEQPEPTPKKKKEPSKTGTKFKGV